MSDAKERFSGRVENYVKYRPSYPGELVGLLARECGLAPEWAVADVGSGTGLLAELFVRNGNLVYGVEPNRAMREAGERHLGGSPRFVSVDGSAEATGLEARSVALVTAGQAFHWFDHAAARREFSRILEPGGWVALVWNLRREEATEFMRDYEALLRRFGTDYLAVNHKGTTPEQLDAFFGAGRYETASLASSQTFDYAGLEGRLLSASYVPRAGEPGYEPMLEALAALYGAHERGGAVTFEYDTKVFYGRLAPDQ